MKMSWFLILYLNWDLNSREQGKTETLLHLFLGLYYGLYKKKNCNEAIARDPPQTMRMLNNQDRQEGYWKQKNFFKCTIHNLKDLKSDLLTMRVE